MSEQRRLVRAITRLNIGGPARQALLLTQALDPDWNTTLVAGTPPDEEGELLDPDVTVHRVELVRPLRPRADRRAWAELRRVLLTERPDLVHTHMAKAGSLTRMAALTVRPRPRLVHTFHGHVLEGYFRPAVTRSFLEVERRLARHTDVLVAVSDEIRDQLLELRIGRAEQYRVIRLGFHLEEHRAVAGPSGALRAHLGLTPDVPLVGLVGRLAPVKDVSTTFRAVARVPGVHLAVLGDGELRASLEREATELGIAARTHFTGWWHDIPAAMSDLDVVLLSSINEGTPVALIEAAACSRAVVATDVGGVRSVVDHDRSGLLVSPGNDQAMADAIAELLEHPERRLAMGTAGRDAVNRFTAERLVSDIRSLYDELVPPR